MVSGKKMTDLMAAMLVKQWIESNERADKRLSKSQREVIFTDLATTLSAYGYQTRHEILRRLSELQSQAEGHLKVDKGLGHVESDESRSLPDA